MESRELERRNQRQRDGCRSGCHRRGAHHGFCDHGCAHRLCHLQHPGNSTATAQLPYYLPQSSGPGTPGYVTFQYPSGVTATATAPLAGAFSPDNSIFFVSTQGDNEIHFISIPTNVSTSAPPTDTQQVSPNLPACTPVSAGGNDAGCLYPTRPAPAPSFPPR